MEILFYGFLGFTFGWFAEDFSECFGIQFLTAIEFYLHHDAVVIDSIILCISDHLITHSQFSSDSIHRQFKFCGRIDIYGNSPLIDDLFFDPFRVIIRQFLIET